MKIAEINKNIENAKTTVTACDEEIKDLIQTEEDLYRYQSEVNFFLMNLEDKSK
jgi:protein-arginine kinase